MSWFTWTPLELAANFFTVVCIYLAGRNNIHTWWTGIVACVLFMFVFYNVQLYADMILQVFFMVTGVIGWIYWNQNQKKVPIRKIEARESLTYATGAAVAALGYGLVLHHYTNAYAPFIDSFVLAFSVLAQFLLMSKIKENWLVWIFVNTLSVPLFWSRELYMTSVLYGFFWVNAIWSYYSWNKTYKEQNV